MAATELIFPRKTQNSTCKLAGPHLLDLPEDERSHPSVLTEKFVKKKKRRWKEKLQRKLKH
jgi:hypothetical protein